MKPLPHFGDRILAARRKGMRPLEMVIVSDGSLSLAARFPNPVVEIKDTAAPSTFDWSFLADLNVEIATRGTSERAADLVDALLTGSPRYLRVWNVETGRAVRIVWNGVRQIMIEPEAMTE